MQISRRQREFAAFLGVGCVAVASLFFLFRYTPTPDPRPFPPWTPEPGFLEAAAAKSKIARQEGQFGLLRATLIEFVPYSADFPPDVPLALDRVARWLGDNPEPCLAIFGHAGADSPSGFASYRAMIVRNHLLHSGVPPERLVALRGASHGRGLVWGFFPRDDPQGYASLGLAYRRADEANCLDAVRRRYRLTRNTLRAPADGIP